MLSRPPHAQPSCQASQFQDICWVSCLLLVLCGPDACFPSSDDRIHVFGGRGDLFSASVGWSLARLEHPGWTPPAHCIGTFERCETHPGNKRLLLSSLFPQVPRDQPTPAKMLPQNLSPFSRSLPLGGGQIAKAPSQRALERRAVMKEAIDFFADFKEEAFFMPPLLWISGLGSALSQTCGL